MVKRIVFGLLCASGGVLMLFLRNTFLFAIAAMVVCFLAVYEIDRLVHGYLVEPCRQFGVAAEMVKIVPGLDEAVLQQIEGVVMVEHHLSYLPIDHS